MFTISAGQGAVRVARVVASFLNFCSNCLSTSKKSATPPSSQSSAATTNLPPFPEQQRYSAPPLPPEKEEDSSSEEGIEEILCESLTPTPHNKKPLNLTLTVQEQRASVAADKAIAAAKEATNAMEIAAENLLGLRKLPANSEATHNEAAINRALDDARRNAETISTKTLSLGNPATTVNIFVESAKKAVEMAENAVKSIEQTQLLAQAEQLRS